jgi:hypothetical protein
MIVFCSGMIRAASTLQYNIVRLLVEEMGAGMGVREIERVLPADRRTQNAADVHGPLSHVHLSDARY